MHQSNNSCCFFPALSVLLVTLALVIVHSVRRRSKRYRLPYPPGPPARFGVQNLFDIPKDAKHVEYALWSRKYNSDVVSFSVPGSRTVIVNSAKAVKSLFERRSSIYSDRPHFEMLFLMGWDWSIGFMHYSDYWRDHRRLFQTHFRWGSIHRYYPIQQSLVRGLLKNLLKHPTDVFRLTKHYGATYPIKLAYGHDIDADAEKYMQTEEKAVIMLGSVLFPGSVLLNTFPFLKRFPTWFPGVNGFKTYAEKSKVLTDKLLKGPFNTITASMTSRPASPSLLSSLLKRKADSGSITEEEKLFRSFAANVHVAAADTSMSALTSAVLALLLHPHVQARAQQELDDVVGRDRLPDFSDRPRLPFIDAICREVLRWHVILPMAIAHASVRDDVYDGYFIPKGSTVVGNVWAILHDPEVYPDPERFMPERFITETGHLSDDDVSYAFGFGRRVCPGRYLASASIWYFVASVLSVFNIVHAKDENGDNIPVEPKYVGDDVSHSVPFPCAVQPRDEIAKRLITEVTVGAS